MTITETCIATHISPATGNPRNSEGSFLQLDDGRLVFAYSRYHADSWYDHAACAICAVYSTDEGASWTDTPEQLVSAADYGQENVMSVSLMRLANGDIGLFYLVKYPGTVSEYRMRRYRGDFSHLVEDVKIIPGRRPGYYVVNNDRVCRLANGRLIVPAALHPSAVCAEPGTPDAGWTDGRGSVVFFSSEDDGHSWKELWPILTLADGNSRTGLQEPGVIELPGGVLYSYFRTDRMWQYESVSLDGGERWFNPQPSRFTAPASPMLIKKNPYSGRYLAVWNPVPEYQTRPRGEFWTAGRNPLVMADSTDGVHFSAPIIIEDDPTRGFCYPAIHFLDENRLLLAYCSGGPEDGSCLNRLTIRRITLG